MRPMLSQPLLMDRRTSTAGDDADPDADADVDGFANAADVDADADADGYDANAGQRVPLSPVARRAGHRDGGGGANFALEAAAASAAVPAAAAGPLHLLPPPMCGGGAELFFGLHRNVVSVLLSFVGGYVDGALFEALFEVFTANITGNLVYVVTADWSSPLRLVRLIVVAVFAGGAMLAGVIARCAERCGAQRHKPTVLATLALEIAIVAALCIAGRLMEPALARASRASPGGVVMFLGAISALAMGLQNGLVREHFMPMPPTTIMTSVLVSAALVIVDLAALCARPGAAAEAATPAGRATLRRLWRHGCARLAEFGLPLLAFVGGSALGSFLQRVGGFLSLAVPCAVLGVLWLDVAALLWRERALEAAAAAAAATAAATSAEAAARNGDGRGRGRGRGDAA